MTARTAKLFGRLAFAAMLLIILGACPSTGASGPGGTPEPGILSVDEIKFATFQSTASATSLSTAGNTTDTATQLSEPFVSGENNDAYDYVNGINSTLNVFIPNLLLETLQEAVRQGDDPADGLYVYREVDSPDGKSFRLALTVAEAVGEGGNHRYIGYYTFRVNFNDTPDTGWKDAGTDAKLEFIFNEDYTTITCLYEASSFDFDNAADNYGGVFFDYTTQSGRMYQNVLYSDFGTSDFDDHAYFFTEISRSGDTLSFQYIESFFHETEGTLVDSNRIAMHSDGTNGIGHRAYFDGSDIHTSFLDMDGANLASDDPSGGSLGSTVDTLFSGVDGNTAKARFNADVEVSNFDDSAYDPLLTAHQNNT